MNIHEKLRQPESRKLEFKREIPAKLTDLMKTIAAFANGAGGELIIGVSDKDRTITGVSDPLMLEERIANAVHDSIEPMISPYISVLNVQGKELLIIRILPGSSKPCFIKSMGLEKGVYIRIGSTNRIASPQIIASHRLRYAKNYAVRVWELLLKQRWILQKVRMTLTLTA